MSISYRETSGSDLRIFPSGKVWNFVKSQNKTILRQKRPVSSCLGPECGAFIKMANRPEIPDSYPFKSHLLALQPLSLLFRHEKIILTKMTLEKQTDKTDTKKQHK